MFVYPKHYDVIVVGAGHAGVEAALAAARMGCQTLLLSGNLDTIGQMACNPAIGGLAKGHLAREIDALGGEMGRATDLNGLQFRLLNTRKGPSVRAPRAQCDKKSYQFYLKWVCERQDRLDIQQGQVTGLVVAEGVIEGVDTALEVRFKGRSVVVTTGTFLRGLLHIGANQQSGGRAGEGASMGVSASLQALGLEMGRLKTGTPPRLLKRSLDLDQCEVQPGDEPVPWFSYWRDAIDVWQENVRCSGSAPPGQSLPHPAGDRIGSGAAYPAGTVLARLGGQLPCHITSTTARTRELVLANLHRSPMYSGQIEGVGPRYCPSIEDKFVRFAAKEVHQVFLEPEGIATDEYYINGFSTSLPYEVQVEMVRSLKGCERAEILRPAYAVEYDYVQPTQLHGWLETRTCPGLFLAGQINGTSGYEEAAAQGLMAGVNAALRVLGRPPLVLGRNEAYIGVLIDDLVTRGTREPYRMFTSRAEYRLLLRQDNADLRLSGHGRALGLLSARQWRQVDERRQAIEEAVRRLETERDGQESLAQRLRRPEIGLAQLPGAGGVPESLREAVEIEVKYAGYIRRQAAEIERHKQLEGKEIPAHFDFTTVPGLRTETRDKWQARRPDTVGQAGRVPGVTPADVSLLVVWLKREAGGRGGKPGGWTGPSPVVGGELEGE